ncbi:MAG: non-heme iron oxygenase ferredoxin subunit [Spirochaetia bacterium]|nr:non-heme iron oxygenase ferredoxin subunit [Spirochaetia bacterium]
MTFVKVADESEIPEGGMITVRAKSVRIALAKVDGEIFAFEDVCTHDNGSLSGGSINHGCVVCPRHGARFDLKTGEVKQLPATEGIEIFEVRISEGNIEVNL